MRKGVKKEYLEFNDTHQKDVSVLAKEWLYKFKNPEVQVLLNTEELRREDFKKFLTENNDDTDKIDHYVNATDFKEESLLQYGGKRKPKTRKVKSKQGKTSKATAIKRQKTKKKGKKRKTLKRRFPPKM